MASRAEHFKRELERLDSLLGAEPKSAESAAGDHATVQTGVGQIVAPNGHVTVIVNERPGIPAARREIHRCRKGGKEWREVLLDGIREKALDKGIEEEGLCEIARKELQSRILTLRIEDLDEDELGHLYAVVWAMQRPAKDE